MEKTQLLFDRLVKNAAKIINAHLEENVLIHAFVQATGA